MDGQCLFCHCKNSLRPGLLGIPLRFKRGQIFFLLPNEDIADPFALKLNEWWSICEGSRGCENVSQIFINSRPKAIYLVDHKQCT